MTEGSQIVKPGINEIEGRMIANPPKFLRCLTPLIRESIPC